jgi:hypothetical protein
MSSPVSTQPSVRAVFKHLHGTSLAALLVEQEMADVITVKDTDSVEMVSSNVASLVEVNPCPQ